MCQEYGEFGWMMVCLYSYAARFVSTCMWRNALKTLTHMATADRERWWWHGVFRGVDRRQRFLRHPRKWIWLLDVQSARSHQWWDISNSPMYQLNFPVHPRFSNPSQDSTSVYNPYFDFSTLIFTDRGFSFHIFYLERREFAPESESIVLRLDLPATLPRTRNRRHYPSWPTRALVRICLCFHIFVKIRAFHHE
jgi:hypothetical protein